VPARCQTVVHGPDEPMHYMATCMYYYSRTASPVVHVVVSTTSWLFRAYRLHTMSDVFAPELMCLEVMGLSF
jgi:hypothetical protein